MKKHITTLAFLSLLATATVSCDRYLDVTPVGKAIPTTAEDFRAVLTRAYNLYPTHRAILTSRTDETILNADSDEAVDYKDFHLWNDNSLDAASITMPYAQFYSVIFYTNHIITEGANNMPNGTEKNQILGEAYALRALSNFELVNIYAPTYNSANASLPAIPLVEEINLEKTYPKASVQEVYNAILADLSKAKSLISTDTQSGETLYRFSEVSVKALEARVYLYMNNWQKALELANEVLAYNSSLEDFNNYSVLPSSYKSVEAIMNLDNNLTSQTQRVYRASQSHIDLFDQTNDLRFAKYFTSTSAGYRSTKFASSNEVKSSFRVGEILLLKAEAQAKLNDEAASKETLLTLAIKRYNATGYTNFSTKISSLSGNDYLTELYNERARELSFEGLRWYDLRRTTQPSISHEFSGTTSTLLQNDPRYTLPFPISAKLKNPLL